LDVRLEHQSRDEIGTLTQGFNQMVADLQENVLERQRMQHELELAHDMQMSLMPETIPEIEGVEVFGRCIPSKEVSGDFFEYLSSERRGEIGLVVADATGKGMKAAMNAVMADGILHLASEELEHIVPATLMMKLNSVLEKRTEQDMNITMVIGVVDVENKTLTLANAGHHAHPLLLRNDEVQSLVTRGMPLGMMAGISYQVIELSLQSGDVLIFMTDGIIESQNNEGQLYSDSGRLEEVMSQFTFSLSAEAMVNAIINDAMSYGDDETQEDDDMTVIAVKLG
jgi:sigma-B regulation protein RsbU (phosphoserine phosphatase)